MDVVFNPQDACSVLQTNVVNFVTKVHVGFSALIPKVSAARVFDNCILLCGCKVRSKDCSTKSLLV